MNSQSSSTSSFDGVIFDLDGTLLDSIQDIAEAANRVLHSLGSPTYLVSDYRYLVGDGVSMLFQRALPSCANNDELRTECMQRFEAEYSNCWKNHSKPYDGIAFDMVVGHSDRFPRKPDPASALWMAETLQLHPDRIAYVGDTNTDMKTAANAGFFAIGVAWGFRPETELREYGARVVAHAPSDLKEILLS